MVKVPVFDDQSFFISREARVAMCLIVDSRTFPGWVVHSAAAECRSRRHWQGVKRGERH